MRACLAWPLCLVSVACSFDTARFDDRCETQADCAPNEMCINNVCEATTCAAGDSDSDTVCDDVDSCPTIANPLQENTDGDALGDACDDDDDNDGVLDGSDTSTLNPNVCSDLDADTCDDCALGTDGFGVMSDQVPANDGPDLDADGLCDAGDPDIDGDGVQNAADTCPFGNAFTSTPLTDRDGDGCQDSTEDCDNTIPTCAADCVTNTDAGTEAIPVVDCVETFCGSDPALGSSFCTLTTTQAALNTALANANGNAGPDFILINGSVTLTGALTTLTDANGVTIHQTAGTVITINGGNMTVFTLSGDNNIIDGLIIVNVAGGRTIFFVTGNDNTIMNTAIYGFDQRGLYIRGDRNLIYNNVIQGGTGGVGNDRSGMVLRDPFDTQVVGNVVVQNNSGGIQVRNATNTFFDHNTVSGNGDDGFDFYQQTSTNTCMRNNILTDNNGFAYNGGVDNTFNQTVGCTAPLAAGPSYGNDQNLNAAGLCGGGSCGACSCMPAGTFWEFNLDPLYTSVAASALDFYCIADPVLINGADDLGYDLNGLDTLLFNSTGPDVGARESGSGGCP